MTLILNPSTASALRFGFSRKEGGDNGKDAVAALATRWRGKSHSLRQKNSLNSFFIPRKVLKYPYSIPASPRHYRNIIKFLNNMSLTHFPPVSTANII